MKKFSLFSKKTKLQTVTHNYAEHFVAHHEADVFLSNPKFQEFLKSIEHYSSKGIINVAGKEEGVIGKSGEVTLKNGERFYVASFAFVPQNEKSAQPSRYIELRTSSQLSGIGNVWTSYVGSKYTFMFENHNSTNFGQDLVCVIKNNENTGLDVDFFDVNKWLGNFKMTNKRQNCKFVVSQDLLTNNGKKDEFLQGELHDPMRGHPLAFLKRQYKQNAKQFLCMPVSEK